MLFTSETPEATSNTSLLRRVPGAEPEDKASALPTTMEDRKETSKKGEPEEAGTPKREPTHHDGG